MGRTSSNRNAGGAPATAGSPVLTSQTRQRAHTVAEFCLAYRISRAFLYALWKRGMGPGVMRVGRRTLISVDAAEAWRLSLEGAPRRDASGGAR